MLQPESSVLKHTRVWGSLQQEYLCGSLRVHVVSTQSRVNSWSSCILPVPHLPYFPWNFGLPGDVSGLHEHRCRCTCIYICMYIYVYICICVCFGVDVCVCVCVCVCVYICISVYICMRHAVRERVTRKSVIWTSRYKENARLDDVVCDKTAHISPSEIGGILHFCSWCDVRWGNVSEPNVSQVWNQPVFAQCEYESRQKERRDVTLYSMQAHRVPPGRTNPKQNESFVQREPTPLGLKTDLCNTVHVTHQSSRTFLWRIWWKHKHHGLEVGGTTYKLKMTEGKNSEFVHDTKDLVWTVSLSLLSAFF
jgi:hypothetical protein